MRMQSDFFGDAVITSSTTQNLVVDGYSHAVSSRFFNNLPVVALAGLLLLVAYSMYSTYRGAHHNLKVSRHYINAKQEAMPLISLRFTSLGIASFILPLLYWSFFVLVWFPAIIKIPLRYIIGNPVNTLILSAVWCLLLLTALTHIGILLTRLANKAYAQALKG